MRRLKPITGILIVFFLGAVAGVLFAHFYSTFESRKPHHRLKPEERVEFIMRRLTNDLGLSEPQQKEIRQIVSTTEEKVRSIKGEYESKSHALHDASIKEIRARLTPDQRAKFDRKHAEWKRRRQEKKAR